MTIRLKISWFTRVKVSESSEARLENLHGNVVRRSSGDLIQFIEKGIGDDRLRSEPDVSIFSKIFDLNTEICSVYKIDKKVAYLWADPNEEGALKLNFHPKWLELFGNLDITLSIESSLGSGLVLGP